MPDGTYDLTFGYLNRNYEEQPEIPIGPDNSFSPGAPDRGQPTHFYPRRQQFMFKIRVPADFGKQELTWTLTRGGRTDKAVGPSGARVGAHRSRLQPEPARARERLRQGSSEPAADHLDRWENGDHRSRRRGHAHGLGQGRWQSKAAGDVGRGSRAWTRRSSRLRSSRAGLARCSSRSFSRAAAGSRSRGRTGADPGRSRSTR